MSKILLKTHLKWKNKNSDTPFTSMMREHQKLIQRIFIILFMVILFTLISIGAFAKQTVKAGEDKTVDKDEEVEFRGVGIGGFSWDFNANVDANGDGNYTNDNEATGNTVTHKFTEVGTYTVTLTVRQDGNITSVVRSEITVEEPLLFDPWIMGLIFVIIGVIMLLAEASSPGFFIGIPATILIVIGIIGIGFPGLFFTIWSPIIAAIVAAVTTITIIIFYKKLAPPEAPTTTVGESLVGKTGIVMVDTEPDNLTKGKVKIGSDIWSATSEQSIKKGNKVVVIASEGVHITVEKVK